MYNVWSAMTKEEEGNQPERQHRLYSVKMRASANGTHLSGAERLVPPERVAATLSALAKRAFGHERGVPDSVYLKAETRDEVMHISPLPVSTFEVATPEEGWRKAEELLAAAGIERAQEIRGLFDRTFSLRGAMLLDVHTLERLEPDRERGVRATHMDSDPSPRADRKDHFAEALTLASKVLHAPGVVGEVCVSDDPSYVTGYVATRNGYHRITKLKAPQDPRGGRIFLYDGRREDVAETIRFIEKTAVIVDRDIVRRPRLDLVRDDLAAVDAAGLRREVKVRNGNLVSFASNDYLGLSQDQRVKEAAARAAAEFGAGTGASRLVTGTLPPHVRLERHIADFKGAEGAITFATGYMANVGAITALVGRGDAVLSDALNHASIVDGCRLSGAEVVVYPHLDLDALDRALRNVRGARRVLVVSDGVFSMDGDLLDLPRFLEICERHQAFSMVDEAHALGVVGATGHGLSEHFGCGHPDLMMGTLSKALGSSGGYVAGCRDLVEYLRQKARPFIFSTAPGAASVAAADAALSILETEPGRVARLRDNVRAFGGRGESAVIPVPVGDERKAVAVSAALEAREFLIPAIRYPTVARGEARLRVAVRATHSADEIVAARQAVEEEIRRMERS